MIKIKTLIKSVMFFLAGSIILASCQNNIENNQEAYLSFSDVAVRAATHINPNFSLVDFEQFSLIGSNSSNNDLELGQWDNFNSLQESYIAIPDLGEWSFTLKAEKDGTIFSGTASTTIVTGNNSVFFELYPEEFGTEGNGSVNIGLKLQDIPYVENESGIQIDYDVTYKVVNSDNNSTLIDETPAVLKFGTPDIDSGKVDVSVVWEKESVPAGNYFVHFYVNKGDIKHVVNKVLTVTVSPNVLSTNEEKYNSENSDEYLTINESVIVENTDVTKCSINYILNYGTFASQETVPYTYNILSDADLILPIPERLGYEFKGWFKTSSFDEGTEIYSIFAGSAEDYTLYAKWEVIPYIISYNINGGIISETYETSYTVESDITLPVPTKTGYNFGGWYTTSTFDEGTEITFITAGSSGDVNIYAKWNIITYNITYELNGGTISETYEISYTVESDITLPVPVKDNYVFLGWYENGDVFTKIPAGSIGDRQFTAEWAEKVYSIKYNSNGGTMPESYATMYSGAVEITLPVPVRDNYDFLGWYENDEVYTKIPAGSIGDRQFTAKWAEQVYSITYNSNDGTMPESYATMYSGAVEITLPVPTKTGYNFGGWYTTSTFDEGTEITSIPAGSFVDFNIYAKWNLVWTVSSTDTYYFEQSSNTWTSNNQGQDGTSATTTWTITLPESAEVSIPWTVSSEATYDKLTVTLDSSEVVSYVSGEQSGTITATLSAGTHTLTATYSKDGSVNSGSDCATITLDEIVY